MTWKNLLRIHLPSTSTIVSDGVPKPRFLLAHLYQPRISLAALLSLLRLRDLAICASTLGRGTSSRGKKGKKDESMVVMVDLDSELLSLSSSSEARKKKQCLQKLLESTLRGNSYIVCATI